MKNKDYYEFEPYKQINKTLISGKIRKDGKLYKVLRIRTKDDERYPNEIEVLDGSSGKALKLDEKTIDQVLEFLQEARISKDLVARVENNGYFINYGGGA